MAYMTTGMIDRGDPSCEVEAAICKVFGSEAGWRGINEAIQVMGGTGFMKDWPFERIMRDCRILSIFEGTNEILRMLIALTGMRAVGDRLTEVGKAAKNPLALLPEAQERLAKRFFPKDVQGVHPQLKPLGQVLQANTLALGNVVETLLRKHGKNIMNQQVQLRRVADITIDLYGIAATVSRASRSLEQGTPTAAHEKKLAEAFAELAENRIKINVREILTFSKSDEKISSIADEIFKENKYLPPHPTNV
eukprot:Colp12_sorted_trinity150504_noHs@23112